jgi:hypothetical protein
MRLHVGGPSLKGSPNFALFVAPKTHLAHLGKGRKGQVWMVVISYYGDWRLNYGKSGRYLSGYDNNFTYGQEGNFDLVMLGDDVGLHCDRKCHDGFYYEC